MAGHYNPRDKEQVQEWAQSLFRLDNFYVLDTETSGVGKLDEIVQIGIVDKYGSTVLNTLVKPTRPLLPAVIAVHGITNERLREALPFTEFYVRLSALLAGQTLVAYNMAFDWRMLAQTTALYRLPNLHTGVRHCAMLAYARYRGQFDLKKRSYRWYKLSEACTQQRIKVENAHDALGDVQMTLALLAKMAGR
ncbi:MAG: 3'-5' exonuclease [Anaerolineae bacterium]|jgi:DNA polymerase-3 subunit epsilon|nr:3'-5' exonuclease [Anaerolineae bacterium]